MQYIGLAVDRPFWQFWPGNSALRAQEGLARKMSDNSHKGG
jgi:hypothetical protein